MHQNTKHNMELSWAAGFFDGEGSTGGFTPAMEGRSLSIHVPQVDIRPLYRFRDAVNGKQKITLSRQKDHKNPIHVYREYGANAMRVVKLLYPFLSEPKREQILRALSSISFRSIKKPNPTEKQTLCLRGHKNDVYIRPNGNRECYVCKRMRRKGILPPIPYKFSLPKYINIREYHPALKERTWVPPDTKTARGGISWTFGLNEKDYKPIKES